MSNAHQCYSASCLCRSRTVIIIPVALVFFSCTVTFCISVGARRVKALVEKHVPRHPRRSFFTVLACQIVTFVWLVYEVVYVDDTLSGWWWLWKMCAAMFCAMCEVGIGFNVLHDSSHFGVFAKPAHNELASQVMNAFVFWNGGMWHNHHVHLHHSFTGDPFLDPDATTFDKYKHCISRSGIPTYILPFSLSFFQSLAYYASCTHRSSDSDMNIEIHAPVRLSSLSVCEVMALSIKMGMLYHFGMLAAVWYLMSFSFFYYINIIGDHDQADCYKRNYAGSDWLLRQVHNSGDFMTSSSLWTAFFGGINRQTAHHLFPSWNNSRLPEISDIISAELGDSVIMSSSTLSEYFWQLWTRKPIDV